MPTDITFAHEETNPTSTPTQDPNILIHPSQPVPLHRVLQSAATSPEPSYAKLVLAATVYVNPAPAQLDASDQLIAKRFDT